MATIRVESFGVDAFGIVAERKVPREITVKNQGGTFKGQNTETLYWSGSKWLSPASKSQTRIFPSKEEAESVIATENLGQYLPSDWQEDG